MLESTGTTMNQYSTEVRGDAYYGYSDGYHTIQVIYNQFVGRLRIQATLDLTPESADWFDIVPTSTGTEFNPLGYIQFNSNEPANTTEAYSFQGNFTFIRIYMDREHVGDGSTYDTSYGQINRAILSA
jgi:hypothetical protein